MPFKKAELEADSEQRGAYGEILFEESCHESGTKFIDATKEKSFQKIDTDYIVEIKGQNVGVEVKTDATSSKTKNLAYEVFCQSTREDAAEWFEVIKKNNGVCSLSDFMKCKGSIGCSLKTKAKYIYYVCVEEEDKYKNNHFRLTQDEGCKPFFVDVKKLNDYVDSLPRIPYKPERGKEDKCHFPLTKPNGCFISIKHHKSEDVYNLLILISFRLLRENGIIKEGRGLNDNVLKDTFLQEYHTTEELREHFKNKAAD